MYAIDNTWKPTSLSGPKQPLITKHMLRDVATHSTDDSTASSTKDRTKVATYVPARTTMPCAAKACRAASPHWFNAREAQRTGSLLACCVRLRYCPPYAPTMA